MCGIVALVAQTGRQGLEGPALDQLRHRGPDSSGQWHSPDGKVWLGHHQLAILYPTSMVTATMLTLGLAWKGIALWALLAVDLAVSVLSLAALYLWHPAWRARLVWSSAQARYYSRATLQTWRLWVCLAVIRVLCAPTPRSSQIQ
jgi:hypothetical protein